MNKSEKQCIYNHRQLRKTLLILVDKEINFIKHGDKQRPFFNQKKKVKTPHPFTIIMPRLYLTPEELQSDPSVLFELHEKVGEG